MSNELPTFDQMKTFLVERYKHDRLYGRTAPTWPANYGDIVVNSALEDLERYGIGFISQFEAQNGHFHSYKFVDNRFQVTK